MDSIICYIFVVPWLTTTIGSKTFILMKKLVKAVIIGYSVLWLIDTCKEWFGDSEIKNLEDIKKILKDKL